MLLLRIVYLLMGTLLIVAACYLAVWLYRADDMVILASVSPGILGAAVFGTILIIRALQRLPESPE